MTTIYLRKIPGGLVPVSDEDAEAIKRFKIGSVVKAKVTNPRSYKFHQKFFVLVGVIFDLWCETKPTDQEYRGIPILPDKDRFREDLLILCGHFTATYAIDGSVKLRAKSISFSSMDEESFDKLYQKMITVALEKILPNRNLKEKDLNDWVNTILNFAGN